MLGKSTDASPQTTDSFYDDHDESHPSAPPFISSIRIVTSKPPMYRRPSETSDSPSPSSCSSDRDVTDVSSMGGDNRIMHEEKSSHHPFHLQSMRHVLLGPSAATSRPPSPVHPPSPDMIITKKHVRIVTNETDHGERQRSHPRHSNQQPYIHGHRRDSQRIRLTSSAINRQKQQQRIERENLVSASVSFVLVARFFFRFEQKILERLQQARATRGLKRDELLSHYDRQIGYVSYPNPAPPGVSAMTTTTSTSSHRSRLPTRPSSASNFNATFNTSEKSSTGKLSRPSSASHLLVNPSARSRPVSAPTSINGSSRSSSSRRPIWNDRWQQHRE